MNLYYVFFSNICTYAGAIGAAIFGVMSIVVAVQQLNTPSDDKKFVEMICCSCNYVFRWSVY